MVGYLAVPETVLRLKVSDTQVTELNAARDEWLANYVKYLAPETHTRGVVLEADRLYKIASNLAHKLQQQVKNNAEVELTGGDYTALGIHMDKPTRTPTPVEKVAPNVVMVKAIRLSNEFYTTYPDSEGNAHRRLPHRNHLQVKVAHTEPGAAPPQERDFDEVYQSNKATFALVAPVSTPLGTVGYVKTCDVTFSGKQRPEGGVFQFVIKKWGTLPLFPLKNMPLRFFCVFKHEN